LKFCGPLLHKHALRYLEDIGNLLWVPSELT